MSPLEKPTTNDVFKIPSTTLLLLIVVVSLPRESPFSRRAAVDARVNNEFILLSAEGYATRRLSAICCNFASEPLKCRAELHFSCQTAAMQFLCPHARSSRPFAGLPIAPHSLTRRGLFSVGGPTGGDSDDRRTITDLRAPRRSAGCEIGPPIDGISLGLSANGRTGRAAD